VGFVRAASTSLHHVKLHGELASQCNSDPASARAYVEAVARFGDEIPVYVNPRSEVWGAAMELGVRAVLEFYADMPLSRDGDRVPPDGNRRHGRHPQLSPASVRARVRELLATGRVEATDGERVEVEAETISVHTDDAEAVDMARAVRDGAEDAGVELSSDLNDGEGGADAEG
jgi:UPF0271 protein